MSKIFTSAISPSDMYFSALQSLLKDGEECAPRGKKIKELRPVILEFVDPLKRLTFLKGRVINPFFQMAESLWIVDGRSDVKWLTDYNSNMGQFSDDGRHFNAPYGERLRSWNKSNANNTPNGLAYQNGQHIEPLDQLLDVYRKIKADPDTRQAVAVIYNPLYDNADHETKDRPCNMILTFKLRNGMLDLNVFNRSNDIHWGVFGANMCQFSTILEMMAAWLGVKVGTYYQTTDSLHVYTEDYGATETDKILKANLGTGCPMDYYFGGSEPRMSFSFDEMQMFRNQLHVVIDASIQNCANGDDKLSDAGWNLAAYQVANVKDDYWRMVLQSMMAYTAHKAGKYYLMIDALRSMPMCSWKVSCLRFLSKRYMDKRDFEDLYGSLNKDVRDYIERKGE